MNTQPNNDNRKLLLVLMTAMTLIVVTMVASIFMVTRRPVVVVIPSGGDSNAPAGENLPPPGELAGSTPIEAPPEITVVRLPQAPTSDDPLDALWSQVAEVDIPLQAQQVAEPMLPHGTVATIRVQAARDSARFVWRLSWEQAEPTVTSDFGQFSDAVALQFPLVDGAPYTMGGPDLPVTILYWKAIWQKDVDEGFQDTVVVKPNAHNDFYWFASHTGPYGADQLLRDNPSARQWLIAASAGNPMTNFERKCPLEQITAHGFGTSTHVPEAAGQARGRWHEGRWYVVFERPITPGDKLLDRFQQNPQQQLIALAVWDGQAQNRGGQKHITNWLPMRITP